VLAIGIVVDDANSWWWRTWSATSRAGLAAAARAAIRKHGRGRRARWIANLRSVPVRGLIHSLRPSSPASPAKFYRQFSALTIAGSTVISLLVVR